MQRWQGAALAVVLCAGCLDPMVGDEPGYSRYVLEPGSAVPSAYDDLQINRKIDNNDGAMAPAVALKNGFAAGQPVRYWDFGASKRSSTAAYGLARCTPDAKVPVAEHPLIVDTIPGDTDYSPFRAIQWACLTGRYRGEIIPSLDALYDAIDLGLVTDPTADPLTSWVNLPIVAANVGLTFPAGALGARTMYYRGSAVFAHTLETQEGSFPYVEKNVPTGNVYELMKPGQMAAARVIFSQPYADPNAPGARNPLYSPNWLVVTVTLKAFTTPMNDPAGQAAALDALIETLDEESEIVKVGMNNSVTANHAQVQSVMVTMNRVNRPFLINEVTP